MQHTPRNRRARAIAAQRQTSVLTPQRVALGLGAAALAAWAGAAQADGYEMEAVAEGFDSPWGIDFLPGGGEALITEREGALKLVDIDSGAVSDVDGLPDVDARGQGGLLDVAVHPDFEENSLVYMTWADADADGNTATMLGRATLDTEAMELTDLEELHAAGPHVDATGHYGSRIAFDGEGHVYFSTGDRQSKDFGPDHYSQDISHDLGKILRVAEDGSIPDDNPFVEDADASDAIWSYGHRNPQGMAFHPETGELWANEHGENNGDEINVIQRGGNFGWPIATWGVDYRTGEVFADTPPENPDTIDPVYWWDPDHPEGFPPSGFLFYQGDAFPDWQGDAFMGNLAHQYLGQFSIEGHEVEQTGRLLEDEGWRIRDIAEGPADGFIYVLIDDDDVPLIRLTPQG